MAGALMGWAVVLAAGSAEAQQMITGEYDVDTARVSGFVWRGDVNGTIDAPSSSSVVGFGQGIDVATTLGLTSAGTGWLLNGDFGAARRHRFLVSLTGVQHSGVNRVTVPLGDGAPALDLVVDSRISIRDVHGAYNFLFVETDWIDVGAIAGAGYFASAVGVTADVFALEEDFGSPYLLAGGNVLLHAEDIMSVYAEFTGAPGVGVGDYGGWQSQLQVLFLVYPTPNIGFSAGYQRYRLSLEDPGRGTAVDLVWDGYVVGGQYRF